MNKKIFIISIIVLVIDQVSKGIITSFLKVNQSIKVIKNFFSLTYVQNTGAAFGILSNNIIIIFLITLFSSLVIYKFMYSFQKNKRNTIAFGLVIGGLLGNLIDRIIFSYVIDFLDFTIFNYNYPVFNISDIAIVVGIFLLIIAIVKGEDVNGNNCQSK